MVSILILCLLSVLFLFYFLFLRKKIKELYTNKRVVGTLLEYMPGAIIRFIYDTKRTIKYVSSGIKIVTGYESESFINNKRLSYLDIIYPIDKDKINHEIELLTIEKKIYRIEYRIITKQGSIKWVSENGVGIFNKLNKLIAIEGFIVDITERKSVEEFLIESNTRFLELIDQAPMGICIVYDDQISYSNPGYNIMFGLPGMFETVGNPIYNNISPESIPDFKESLLKVKSDKNISLKVDVVAIHSNGQKLPVQVFINNVTMEGNKGLLIFFIDISDRKKAEEYILSANTKLNDIIDLIPDPTFVIDRDKKVTHWNHAMEELTGFKKEDVLQQGDYIYSKAFYGDQRPMLIDLIDMSDKQVEENYEYVKKVNDKLYAEYSGLIPSRGKKFYLWGVAAPLYDNKGNRFGAIEVIKDVTEEKIKELAIINNEKKARLVMDSNQDYIILLQPDGLILDCNTKFAEALNKTRTELSQNKIQEFLRPKVIDFWNKIINEIISKGQSKIIQYQWESSKNHYLISLYPTINNEKNVDKIAVYIKNISKLKNTELALRESKSMLQKITKSITDYIYTIHFDKTHNTQQFKNIGYGTVFGYTDEDFENNPNLWQDIIYEEDSPSVTKFLEEINTEISPNVVEHRIYHKNGQILWISNTLMFFKKIGDEMIEYLGVIKDITARKQAEIALAEAEERYRRVFDQSGLINTVYDLNGKLLMQNTYAASLLGGKPVDFIGKNVSEIYPPEVSKAILQRIQDTTKNKLNTQERFLKLPSGEYWLKTTNHPIKNDFGEIIAAQLISLNITDKKDLDKKILNKVIETEEKERIHFAQELHDGLGPVISAIKMYINWMNMPDAKVPQEEILSDTLKLLDEASSTIREISFKLSPHILSNFGLVEAIRSFVEKIKITKNVIIESNLTKRLDNISETILYRVLCECINNTVKHANASEIIIKLRQTKDLCKITFLDDGKGFDAKEALNRKSGIGLLNIQNRIQSINGKFFINSKPQVGTKINITVRL